MRLLNLLSMKIAGVLIALVLIIAIQTNDSRTSCSSSKKNSTVVLLHGLGRTSRCMTKMEKSLAERGYRVVNVDYPSRDHSIEHLAENVLGSILKQIENSGTSKIHFVTHSMGGIVVRYYLAYNELDNLGRVVMISPPNQGTELADSLKNFFLFETYSGPAGRQLGTGKDSLPQELGPVSFDLGVIAGNRSLSPLYSLALPGPDDGIVSVERTKVEGMADFIVLPHTHTFIMDGNDTIEQVVHFLEKGRFARE